MTKYNLPKNIIFFKKQKKNSDRKIVKTKPLLDGWKRESNG